MTADAGDVSWETLNAYVDGELAPADAARVADRAALDAGVAARIATLSKLKAGVTGPLHRDDALPPMPVLPRPAPRKWLPIGAVAAAAMIAVVLGARLFIAPTPTWRATAVAAQQQWLASATQRGDGPTAVAIGASTATRPLDLSDAELTLVYAAPLPRDATFLGYRGSHGCMVGLWIGAPQDDLAPAPRGYDDSRLRIRAWRDQTASYALIAKGIDPAKLDRLTAAVVKLVDPHQTIDDGIRTALRDAARTGAPCRV